MNSAYELKLKMIWCAPIWHYFLTSYILCGTSLSYTFTRELPGCARGGDYNASYCLSNIDVNASMFAGRNVYMLGNSVIRHYSFSVISYLNYMVSDISMDRQKEKKKCTNQVGVSHCDHITANKDTKVSFYWRNVIGLYERLHDDRKDICVREGVISNRQRRVCLEELFSNADKHDILIVGSIPADIEKFNRRNYSSIKGGIHNFCRVIVSLETPPEYIRDVAIQLLSVFPGLVLWLSYPYVICGADCVACIKSMNVATREGITMVESTRATFLNLLPLQTEFSNLYIDVIHHPGKLSQMAIKFVYQTIQPNIRWSTQARIRGMPEVMCKKEGK